MKNLNELKSKELKKIAKDFKVANWWSLSKADLIKNIEAINARETGFEESSEVNTEIIETTVGENIGADKNKINEPMKMSETVKTLEAIFDKLNDIYFDNALPKAVITVQSTPSAYGHCSTKKYGKMKKSQCMK